MLGVGGMGRCCAGLVTLEDWRWRWDVGTYGVLEDACLLSAPILLTEHVEG